MGTAQRALFVESLLDGFGSLLQLFTDHFLGLVVEPIVELVERFSLLGLLVNQEADEVVLLDEPTDLNF